MSRLDGANSRDPTQALEAHFRREIRENRSDSEWQSRYVIERRETDTAPEGKMGSLNSSFSAQKRESNGMRPFMTLEKIESAKRLIRAAGTTASKKPTWTSIDGSYCKGA